MQLVPASLVRLAKMLLVSLGYNPDIEKFTGNAEGKKLVAAGPHLK